MWENTKKIHASSLHICFNNTNKRIYSFTKQKNTCENLTYNYYYILYHYILMIDEFISCSANIK